MKMLKDEGEPFIGQLTFHIDYFGKVVILEFRDRLRFKAGQTFPFQDLFCAVKCRTPASETYKMILQGTLFPYSPERELDAAYELQLSALGKSLLKRARTNWYDALDKKHNK